MNITSDLLREKKAYEKIVEWFEKAFPAGAEYQEMLEALAKEDKITYALWTFKNFGALDKVYEADEINTKHSFFFAGAIKIKSNIRVKGHLLAGKYIEAGGDISVYFNTNAGEHIYARDIYSIYGGITAGKWIKSSKNICVTRGILSNEWIEATGNITAEGESIVIAKEWIEAGEYIDSGREIQAGEHIKAGGYIHSGEWIRSGKWIEAGGRISTLGNIEAREWIKAGEGCEIIAGFNPRETNLIISKEKPDNIKVGVWKEYQNKRGD